MELRAETEVAPVLSRGGGRSDSSRKMSTTSYYEKSRITVETSCRKSALRRSLWASRKIWRATAPWDSMSFLASRGMLSDRLGWALCSAF